MQEHCDQGSLLTAIQKGVFLPTSKFGPKVALRALYRTAREVAQGMLHLHTCKVGAGIADMARNPTGLHEKQRSIRKADDMA